MWEEGQTESGFGRKRPRRLLLSDRHCGRFRHLCSCKQPVAPWRLLCLLSQDMHHSEVSCTSHHTAHVPTAGRRVPRCPADTNMLRQRGRNGSSRIRLDVCAPSPLISLAGCALRKIAAAPLLVFSCCDAAMQAADLSTSHRWTNCASCAPGVLQRGSSARAGIYLLR